MAQFRQFGNQGRRGDTTDAGHVLQQLGQDGAVPLNLTEHFSVDILKLTGDGLEEALDAQARDRAGQVQALRSESCMATSWRLRVTRATKSWCAGSHNGRTFLDSLELAKEKLIPH